MFVFLKLISHFFFEYTILIRNIREAMNFLEKVLKQK
jgi:hypothetical protein